MTHALRRLAATLLAFAAIALPARAGSLTVDFSDLWWNDPNGSESGWGVNVIQQYFRQRLIDEVHIAVAPVLLGMGERLFDGVNLRALGYACTQHEASPQATHIVLSRQ